MDENAKKKGLRMIPYGLQVLGAKHGDKSTVATVNWTTQASFAPPLVVVGIKTDSTAHELVKQSKKFTLSMLGTGQKDLAFAFFKHVEPKDGKYGDLRLHRRQQWLPDNHRRARRRRMRRDRFLRKGRPQYRNRRGHRGASQ